MENVEELESQHVALKRRISGLVAEAVAGENDGAEIATLTREAAALGVRVQTARTEKEDAQRRKEKEEYQQVLRDLEPAREATRKAREEFYEHYRLACLALGTYFALFDKARQLTNGSANSFGVPPQNASALRALDLAGVQELIADFNPVTGFGWNQSYIVAPATKKGI